MQKSHVADKALLGGASRMKADIADIAAEVPLLGAVTRHTVAQAAALLTAAALLMTLVALRRPKEA